MFTSLIVDLVILWRIIDLFFKVLLVTLDTRRERPEVSVPTFVRRESTSLEDNLPTPRSEPRERSALLEYVEETSSIELLP